MIRNGGRSLGKTGLIGLLLDVFTVIGNNSMATQKARKSLIPGLSRKEIAKRLGVSWRTVERWEQRQKWPKWVDKFLSKPERKSTTII